MHHGSSRPTRHCDKQLLRHARRFALSVAIASVSACTGLRGPDLATPTSAPSSASTAVVASLNAADAELARFFDDPHWEGFRNLTAGARGVFLAPKATTAGFIVGAEFANGMVLARHGSSWSDPVFVRLSNYDVGFLAGAEKSTVLMLILTDAAIDQFVQGTRKISSSGGFALGEWGVGGMGAGGISSGAQVITAQTSSGLFAGGGLGSAQMSLDADLNAAAFGRTFDARRILDGTGGQLAAAYALRARLAAAARAGAR